MSFYDQGIRKNAGNICNFILRIKKKNGLMLASLKVVSLRKPMHEFEIILHEYIIDILKLN